MSSYKQLVATRTDREKVLRDEYVNRFSADIEFMLDEEEAKQQFHEISSAIVRFGKSLATGAMKFEQPIIYRSSTSSCKRYRAALLCPGIFLDKHGTLFMSLGSGPYYDMAVSTARYKGKMPNLVIPITDDNEAERTISLAELKLVSKLLRDHMSIDWDYDPEL